MGGLIAAVIYKVLHKDADFSSLLC